MKRHLDIGSGILLKLTIISFFSWVFLYGSVHQPPALADTADTVPALLITQTTKILASDAAVNDHFGDASLALSGDTAVIGAKQKSTDTGAAYIYARNEDGADQWGEVVKLSTNQVGSRFGNAVAIDDETVVIGAVWDGTKGTKAGAAYIYRRNQGGLDAWGLVKKLVPTELQAEDSFGVDVAIEGDTVVVAAYRDDDGFTDAGAVYIFERNQDGADNWGMVKKLHADDPNEGDEFGISIDISSDTIVVGTRRSDDIVDIVESKDTGTAYIFERNQGGGDAWGLVKRLSSANGAGEDGYGYPVAIENDTIVVGAELDDTIGVDAGAVYLYERNTGGADNWGEVKIFIPDSATSLTNFGRSAALDGDIVVIGDSGDTDEQGAIHVYERNTGGVDNWGNVTTLMADDSLAADFLGLPVTIDSNTIITGAHGHDSAGSDAGAAYVFSLEGNAWIPVIEQTATDIMAEDKFSEGAVAISGDTAIVGAQEKSAEIGAAYIFTRNQDGADQWSQVTKLLPNLVQPGDRFGSTVDISGDTAVVGAVWHSLRGAKAGAAYVFERNSGGQDRWGLTRRLIPLELKQEDHFGISVAIDGDMIVVGASGDDDASADGGAIYVFERNTGGPDNWGRVAKLSVPESTIGDETGISVAISGNKIVAGTRRDDDGLNPENGVAYIFWRDQFGAKIVKVISDKPATEDGFGYPVAIKNDTLVVGAQLDEGKVPASGSAYIYEQNIGGADQWGLRTNIFASDGQAGDKFSQSIAMDNEMILVGAPGDEDFAGSAYIFARNADGADQWGQTSKIIATNVESQNYFGLATDLSDNRAIVGSPKQDVTTLDDTKSDEGTFYIYALAYIENELPTVLDDTDNVFRNSVENSLDVLDNDSDPDADNLSILSVGGLAQGGQATTDGQTITYTPAAGFVGAETLTYIASDTNYGQSTGKIIVNVLNRAPDAPYSPSPNDATADISTATVLLWQGSDPDNDALTYDVYLGTTNPPPVLISGVAVNSYNPASLMTNTTYYWQIIANDGLDTKTGPVWSFSTATEVIPNQPPNLPDSPSPQPDSINIPTEVTLSWQGSDPNGDALIYTIAFGTQNPPLQTAANLTDSSYSVTDLSEDTRYYWQISAFDGQAETPGPIWSFNTKRPDTYVAYLPLVLKPLPTGAFTFNNLTENPVTIDLLNYGVMDFSSVVGPHIWSNIPIGTYDWTATGICGGIEGSVGSIFDVSDTKYREPLTILADQTVFINDGEFDCNN